MLYSKITSFLAMTFFCYSERSRSILALSEGNRKLLKENLLSLMRSRVVARDDNPKLNLWMSYDPLFNLRICGNSFIFYLPV
jgi:hypothetical protein